ncbi:MAG: hypothetical protein O7A71_04495, partial [Chloroflexi bacterium]|nr:hypothetical protein [Chloroflexota bacterium]
MTKSLLIGIVVIGLAVLAACSSGDAVPDEPALPEDASFLEQVPEDASSIEQVPEEAPFIEQVEAAWTRAGSVLVIRGERSSVAISEREGVDTIRGLGTMTAWLDAGAGTARYEWAPGPASRGDGLDSATAILIDDRLYEGDGSSTKFIRDRDPFPRAWAQGCGGLVGKVFTAIGLLCHTPWGDFEVEEVDAGGETVVLLTIPVGEPARGGRSPGLTVSFEPATLLPLLFVIDFSFDDAVSLTSRTSYEIEWVARDSLGEDFFDLKWAGYIDVEEPLEVDVGIQVYWLGRWFEPSDGSPTLFLADTLASADGVGPGNRVRLGYSGELGRPVLTLDVWHPDEWATHLEQPIGQVWWSGECVSRTVVELPDGRAEIFAGPVSPTAACSGDDEPTGFIAHV